MYTCISLNLCITVYNYLLNNVYHRNNEFIINAIILFLPANMVTFVSQDSLNNSKSNTVTFLYMLLHTFATKLLFGYIHVQDLKSQ